ncbi:MAG TPA: PQQ-binding-like beta-propeller repeat protein, partial [Egibacteraceae bacterium]|nr:PQQ-binding-like beta-propeller repeat protein [Egibacteraceae bacterium]
VLWEHTTDVRHGGARTLLSADGVVVATGGSGGATAFDAESGEALWQAPAAGEGYLPAVALVPAPQAAVVMLERDGALVSRDLRSGRERWRAQPGGAHRMGLAAGGGVVAVLVADEGANGPQAGTVAVFDSADGSPRWERTVPERLGALLAVEGTVLAHGEIVRYAWDAATGDQRWRVPRIGPFARLAATAQGPAAVTQDEIVLFDAVTSYEHRRVAAGNALPDSVRVEADRLLLSTRDGHAEVRALDGEVLRRLPLGGAGGRPAAGAGLLAVPTHIGVSAFGEDGALRWWHLRELPEERASGG